MRSLLRRFAQANIRVCVALEKRFPKALAAKLGGATYLSEMRRRLAPYQERGGVRILEVGGVDRPLIERSNGYVFAGLDIDEQERCYEVYDEFTVQSVEEPIKGDYDVIYSVTVLEHVPDNEAAARSMFGAQSPGGISMHYVPCKTHPYALLLRLVGTKMQGYLLSLVSHGDEPMGGYPTFFDHCSPRDMERVFREAGYSDVEIVPYYSTTPYFRAFVPIHLLMVVLMRISEALGLRAASAGFLLVARKGGAGSEAAG